MKNENQKYRHCKKTYSGTLALTILIMAMAFIQNSYGEATYFRFYTTTAPSGSGPVNPDTDAAVGVTSVPGASLNLNDTVVFDGVVVSQAPGTSDQWGAVNLDQGGYLGLVNAALAVKAETTEGLDSGGNTSEFFQPDTSFGDVPQTTNHVRIVLTATAAGSTTNMSYVAEVDPGFTDTYTSLSGSVTFPNDTIGLTFAANNAAEKFYDNSGNFAAAQPTPTNAISVPGQTITLTANFEGPPTTPLAVQWFKNGARIAGANGFAYTTPALTSADNGDQFTYVLTNLNNTAITATSPTTTIVVETSPGVLTFNFPTTTVAGGGGAVVNPNVSITGSELTAGSIVVFDGVVVPNGSQASDAWTAINIDGSGYGNVTSAQLGVLCRTGVGANPSQLWINGTSASNPTPGSAQTNRVRIELFVSTTGSTTNMGWLVEFDQNMTGTFLPAVSGTNLTFPNNTLTLTFGTSGNSATVYQDPESPVSIFSGPSPGFQAVAIGAPASVGVTVLGWSPTFQWRKNGVAIGNATNETYTLASASSSDNGDQFTVIVSNRLNSANVVTSSMANLAVVIPNNLTWYPTADYTTWNTTSANWTTNGGVSETLFGSGNNVTFDSLGYNLGGDVVTVTNTVSPNSVTANVTSGDTYEFTGAGNVSGQTLSLNSADQTGTLALQTGVSFASATIASGATLDIGYNGTDGTIAANNLTNNGTMDFQNSGTIAIAGTISGSGTIIQDGSGTTVLSGTNSSYTIGAINNGVLSIASTPKAGTILNNGVLEPASAANVLVIPNSVTGNGYYYFTGFQTTVLTGESGNLEGNNLLFWSDVYVNNNQALGDPVFGSSDVSGADRFGGLYLSNNINWSQTLELDTRYNTGLAATAPHLANASGTNTVSGQLVFGTGTASGVAGSEINVEATAGLLTISSELINGNFNPLNNLNLQGAGAGIWSGALVDGSTPMNVVKRGPGAWTLSAQNTYSGTTTVLDGTLFIDGAIGTNDVTVESGGALSGMAGTINAAVTVESGGNLTAEGGATNSLNIEGTLTLNPGSYTSVDINKSTRGSDQIQGISTLTYGGTLVVNNLSGTLANGDSFKIFSANSYTGEFSAVSPETPGPGLIWTTSTLNTTGILGVATGTYVNTTPTNITATVENNGAVLALGWPADHTGWALQMSTNLAGPNWVTVAGSTTTNQVFVTLNPNAASVFYRMVYP